jgi:hypothetical protein
LKGKRESLTMKKLRLIFAASAGVVIVLALQACVTGAQLTPKPADQTELKGVYTLILYGCRYPGDLENVAVLVDEQSGYDFDVYALDAMYKSKKGLTGSEALNEAEKFIRCGMHTVWQTSLRKISDSTGRSIAYELKPLYQPWEFKTPEVLLSSYSLKDKKITAYFTLDPSLKKRDGLMERPQRERN